MVLHTIFAPPGKSSQRSAAKTTFLVFDNLIKLSKVLLKIYTLSQGITTKQRPEIEISGPVLDANAQSTCSLQS